MIFSWTDFSDAVVGVVIGAYSMAISDNNLFLFFFITIVFLLTFTRTLYTNFPFTGQSSYIVLYCIVLYCIVLYCIVLYLHKSVRVIVSTCTRAYCITILAYRPMLRRF